MKGRRAIFRRPKSTIRVEQAVYGSFAFRRGGYDVLARSKGCRPEWIESLRRACENHGEWPRGAPGPGGIFSLRIDRETRMIVGPADQGIDDQGRPGSLAFHALFVSREVERRIGHDPFALAPWLRRSWPSDTPRILPDLTLPIPEPAASALELDHRLRPIAEAIRRGKRAAIGSNGPIDDWARAVWLALPKRQRRRKSFATWTYSLANRFDFAALPESSPELLENEDGYIRAFESFSASKRAWPRRKGPIVLGFSAMVLGAAALSIVVWLGRGPATKRAVEPPPARSAFASEPTRLEDREALAGALADFARAAGAIKDVGGEIDARDPDALMTAIADRLRYRGPFLTEAEFDRLDRAARAKNRPTLPARLRDWDRRLRRFVDDRPLPADFRRDDASTRWRLAVFAWSFHLDPRLAESEPREAVASILAELARPDPIGVLPESLKREFPALRDQERFLDRLPNP